MDPRQNNHQQYMSARVVIPVGSSSQRHSQYQQHGYSEHYGHAPQNGYHGGIPQQQAATAPPPTDYMYAAHEYNSLQGRQQWPQQAPQYQPQYGHQQHGQQQLQHTPYMHNGYDNGQAMQLPSQQGQYNQAMAQNMHFQQPSTPHLTHPDHNFQHAQYQQQQHMMPLKQQRPYQHQQSSHQQHHQVQQQRQEQPSPLQQHKSHAQSSQQGQRQSGSRQDLSAQFQRRKSSTPASTPTSHGKPEIRIQLPAQPARTPSSTTKPQTPKSSVERPVQPRFVPQLGIDYRLVLLGTADTYIAEAQRIAPALVLLQQSDPNAQAYFTLVANALACYESVLCHPALRGTPRQEAILRLRINSLKFSETDQDDEVEADLSRGIAKCERHRLHDLKYSMEHLLVRVLWKSKAKTGLRYLEKAMEQATAQNHVAWIYAFHFLRVSLLLCSPSVQDHRSAFTSLRVIDETAQRQRDSSILCLCFLFEALIHHRIKTQDFHSEAERALASARAHWMGAGEHALPQLGAMVHLVDLLSSLDPYAPKAASPKVKAFESFFDESIRKGELPLSGVIALPLKIKTEQAQVMHTEGIFTTHSNGSCALNLQWLDKAELFVLGYLANGIEAYAKNPSHAMHMRCEMMLSEGLRILNDDDTKAAQPSRATQHLLMGLSDKTRRRLHLKAYVCIYRSLAATTRSAWNDAAASLRELRRIRKTLGTMGPSSISAFSIFIEGAMHHQSGDFDNALRCYQSPELALDVGEKRLGANTRHELAVLSALGIMLIAAKPSHPFHALAVERRQLLASVFRLHGQTVEALDPRLNPQLVGAYALVTATTHDLAASGPELEHKSILNTKSFLSKALSISKAYNNLLIGAAAFSYMYDALFRGHAGGNALESANASRHAADNSGSVMWQATTAGMMAGACEQAGQFDEAGRALQLGLEVAAGLPRRVQAQLGLADADDGTATP